MTHTLATTMLTPFPLAQAAASPEAGWLGWLAVLSQLATVIIALCLLAVAVAMVPAAWNFRKLAGRLGNLSERLRDDAQPAIRHAEAIGENVAYVSAAIREDVRGIHETVARTNRRLDRLSAEAETRLQAFNALLKVVQEEAEDIFIGTASTVRGVRAGAESLTTDGAEEPRRSEGRSRSHRDQE